MENNFDKDDKAPPINLYFQDSSNSDIFDEISSKASSSAMMTSVMEPTKEDIASENKAKVIDIVNKPSDLDNKEPENKPTICRIFSSTDDVKMDENKTSDKIFFDMLSSASKSATAADNISQNTSSIGGYFSAPDAGMVFDNDPVVDELFIKGGLHSSGKNVSSEADRRNDAWIPSNRTRQALITCATAPLGSYTPDRDLLTMPGVVLQEDMADTVYQVVNHYLGEAEALQRKVLTINDVSQDERGLRELIQAECYRAAVNLTSRLLSVYGQGVGKAGFSSKHTLHSVQLWFTRIALLVKLHSWSVAWAESEAWSDLDKPDLYFQFYSELYGGRPGTLIPFSFRVLLAELPQYVHKSQEAFSRLFSILSIVKKIIKNLDSGLSEDGSHIEINDSDREESKKLWYSRETRVQHSIVNIAFQQKDYKLAVDILTTLIDHPHYEYHLYQKRALTSSLGRVFLQLGDVEMAQKYFNQSRSLKSTNNGNQTVLPDIQELIDFGLISIADNDYHKAYEYFCEASTRDPSNIMVINNRAVCLLYQGKQKEAVQLLEDIINRNPALSLHESLLLNLCTLYELESSKSMENKFKMLKLVSKYKGDSLSLTCLKLQMKD